MELLNIRLIAAMFMLICGRMHWNLTLTSSYLKTFVFEHPHDTCGREVQTEEKKSPFSKTSGYVWTWPKALFFFKQAALLAVKQYTLLSDLD